MTKYAGVWTPDKGFGDERDERSSPSPSRFYSAQFNAHREREEAQARLAAWMNGREPQWHWEMCGDWRVFVMRFPGTAHDDLVCAAEHPTEHGRILTWCEACGVDDCGACRWAKAAYLAERKRDAVSSGGASYGGDGLPF